MIFKLNIKIYLSIMDPQFQSKNFYPKIKKKNNKIILIKVMKKIHLFLI